MNAIPEASQFTRPQYVNVGPRLRSHQPATTSFKAQPDSFKWGVIFDHLESRLGSLRMWRTSWHFYWRSLAQFFMPKRITWFEPLANRVKPGHPINDAIIDSTGTLALETCGAGMWSGLTNPAGPWIKLESALPWVKLDADGQEWVDDTEQRIYTVLAGSNFYNQMAQARGCRSTRSIASSPTPCLKSSRCSASTRAQPRSRSNGPRAARATTWSMSSRTRSSRITRCATPGAAKPTSRWCRQSSLIARSTG